MSLVYAHRGASAYAPENTLEAFRLAMEMGADGFELDVHLSADGQLVVIHDETVDRTTNGTGLVREMTLAQLQALIRYFPGKAPELRSIQTQTQEHLACLQGMSLLRRGIKPHKPTGKAGNADPTALVRKCYVNCINLAKNYEAASDDPEYGIAYAQMAAAKRRHCTQLLSLLGSKK